MFPLSSVQQALMLNNEKLTLAPAAVAADFINDILNQDLCSENRG